MDVAWINHQAQLEEAIGAMSQELSNIKGFLERLFVPQAPTTTRGDAAVEERRTEQQAAKTTTRGKVASGRRTNSQQVPQSQAESTQLAVPSGRKTNTKAGPSRPHNEAMSGLPPRSVAPLGSQEKERTGRGPKPTRNVFDRLGQNTEEDLHIHLDARRTSASSKKNDMPAFSPMHDEINELRKRLDKLAAKSSETTPSTTRWPFSLEIQQAPLPMGFCMPIMTTYEGKMDPQYHLDAFNDQMDLLQVSARARCRCFVVTLTATAKKWFRQIEPEMVASWMQLSGLFMH